MLSSTSSSDDEALQLATMPVGFRESHEDGRNNDFVDEDGKLLGAFNVSKPRDFTNGLSHAAQNLAKGVGVGIAGLFTAPIEGAVNSGAKGFFEGLGFGLVGAVSAPVIGVGTGIHQLYSGVMAQSEANDAKGKGLIWNKATRSWEVEVKRTLEEQYEAKSVKYEEQLKKDEAEPSKNDAVSSSAKETHFYDVLELSPGMDTTSNDIKKAYYKKAKEFHPDKNQNDVETAEFMFKEVAEAYQILSDPASRRTYDLHGKAALNQSSFDFDPGMLFGIIFGSEALSPYIGGEFRLSTLLPKILGHQDDSIEETQMDEIFDDQGIMNDKQELRVLRIAIYLRDKISPVVNNEVYNYVLRKAEKHPEKWSTILQSHILEGEEHLYSVVEEWEQSLEIEAAEICFETFGAIYVEALGFAFENIAKQYKTNANIFASAASKIRVSYQNTSDAMSLLTGTVSLFSGNKEMEKLSTKIKAAEEDPDTSPEELDALREKAAALPRALVEKLVQFGLRINLIDVNSTISDAVKCVVSKDTSIPTYERRVRANIIGRLGKVFSKTAKKYKEEHETSGPEVDVEDYLQECLLKAKMQKDADNSGVQEKSVI